MERCNITDYMQKWLTDEIDWVLEIKPKDKLSGNVYSTISKENLGTLVFKSKYVCVEYGTSKEDGQIHIQRPSKITLHLPINMRIVRGFNEKLQNEIIIEKIMENDTFSNKYSLEHNRDALEIFVMMVYSIVENDDKENWSTCAVLSVDEEIHHKELQPLQFHWVQKIVRRLGLG